MNMLENEYEIETEKSKLMRYDTMCKQTTHILSIFPLYYYYIIVLLFSILSKLQLSHTLRSQLKPEQLSTSKLSPPIPLFCNVSVSGLLLFFFFVDLL